MTAAPFILGVIALYNWMIAPHVGYLHAMQRLEPVLGRMAGELDAVSGGLDEKLSRMQAVRRELETVREGLFTREESRVFAHDLQALVGRAGCTLVAIGFTCEGVARTDDPNTPCLVEVSRAELTVQGQYEQIITLLQTLRDRREHVWIDSCRMDLVDPRDGQLKCQLGLTIYASLEPGELRK